ncbi:ribulose-phosphate 3-epimerase [Chlamydia psittaci]|uniref:ribulose-phosphate 3-epimerase n=1 Tax=Chlamydia psittaci TaxID=83554 RepID=UPI00027E1DE3|nr:ribulose-phosphate 3-epimerase [Chlamydia psittaci]AFS25364.1 ribulose-phosphate 3-epimerase [Chlamydia psittaci M56]
MNKKQRQKTLIAPSIMGGDLACIGAEAKRIEESGADLIHIDVMDGHFVPNLTFGPGVIAAINRSTDIFLEVHAMIYTPFDFVEEFVKSGADRIIVHFEASEDLKELLSYIKKCGIQAGLAFSPETSIEFIPPFLPFCDVILLMSVRPGFCGQGFIPDIPDKIRFTKQAIKTMGLEDSCLIEVDGGINEASAKLCREAGADILVAASYMFEKNEQTMEEKVLLLRGENHGIK